MPSSNNRAAFTRTLWWFGCAVLWSAIAGAATGAAVDVRTGATDLVRCVRAAAVVDDLAPLVALSAEARVLALGEPAHGAHEPLALRNRLFEHLIEHGNFTAVALETGFTESRELHDVIASGNRNADLRELTRKSLSWGFGEYEENVELLQWLVAYNADPSHRRKVQFYGIDISGADNQDGFSNAPGAIEAALQSLAIAKPALAVRFRTELAGLLPYFTDTHYSKLSIAQQEELRHILASISNALRPNDPSAWAAHDIVMAQRLQTMFSVRSPRDSNTAMLPDDYRLVNVRDAAMAENVQWVLRREGPKGKVLVFAHNAHVMNAGSRGGIWSVFAEVPGMMGQRLRAALGRKLIVVGTLAGTTDTDLPQPAALDTSLEAVLVQLGEPRVFLDLRRAACDREAAVWLRQLRPIHANFDTWLDVELSSAFDAVELIARLSQAHHGD